MQPSDDEFFVVVFVNGFNDEINFNQLTMKCFMFKVFDDKFLDL